jgi:hypothetical protein
VVGSYLAGWLAEAPVDRGLEGPWMVVGWRMVATHLLFQCIMAWRRLPWARGSGCWSFSSSWCFTLAKCVSSISATSLIHRVHAVCVCVPVAIFPHMWF